MKQKASSANDSGGVPRRKPRVWALYACGFLGPFGGGMTTTMLPEMGHSIHVGVSDAALSITAYMVPFAAVLLVSGSLAERWGKQRTLRIAYAVYIASSALILFASSLGLLLLGRGLQGIANAFVTPVLLAVLSDMASPDRLGRTLGLFGSCQAAGQAMAPFAGGVAAELGWRWAFAASALVGLVLMVTTPAGGARRAPDAEKGSGNVLRRGVIVAAFAAAAAYLTMMGMLLLGALIASDTFGANPTLRGLVVASCGVAGLAAGPLVGAFTDRVGIRVAGAVLALVLAGAAVIVGLAPALIVMVLGMLIGGAANTGVRAATSVLAVRTVPNNRGGAVSFVLAFQFVGAALAPVIWVPLYHANGDQVLAWAGGGAVVAAVLLGLFSGASRKRRAG